MRSPMSLHCFQLAPSGTSLSSLGMMATAAAMSIISLRTPLPVKLNEVCAGPGEAPCGLDCSPQLAVRLLPRDLDIGVILDNTREPRLGLAVHAARPAQRMHQRHARGIAARQYRGELVG